MLGIVLMVLDHVHQMFAPLGIPEWFTMLGRAVAPMFIFIAVEGFTHTRSKRRYLTRLLVGYWIMGGGSYILQKFLPLDHGHYGLANNIFGTLFISVLMMPVAIAKEISAASNPYSRAVIYSCSTICRIESYAIPPGTSGMIPHVMYRMTGIF